MEGTRVKFWQSVSWAEPEQLTEIAKFAEEVGFEGVVNSEHLFLTRTTQSPYPYSADGKMNHALDYAYPDVWSSFAAMAAVTTRLRFTSTVYLLPLRNPIEVAKQAGTCALISNNRVTVGFGVGWQREEFDAMGVDFHTRGKRSDEMIEVMRKLWAGGVVTHHGEFFHFDEIEMRPVPTEPVPFYCGGRSAGALRRAARLCDGFVGPPHDSIEEVAHTLAALERLRRQAGRNHLPFEIWSSVLSSGPKDVDYYKRLEDLGVTAASSGPFDRGGADRGRTPGLGRRSTLDQKKRIMEDFASSIMAKMD
jgi:probable F420-dependent oxidoreductase